MTLNRRFMHSLLAAACLCQALTICPSARSQAAPAAAQQAQEAQPVPRTLADASPGFGDNPEERRMEYSSFINWIAGEESLIERDTQEGRTQRSRVHFQFLGIREDEEQAMRAIVVDAKRQIEENDRQCAEALLDFDQSHSAESKTKVDALRKHRPEIVDETIAKLRQELGEEDFKKLDAYVYGTSSAGIVAAQAKRRANASDPQQSGSGSAPAPVKEPQP